MWNSKEYNQENPLVTDFEGRYAWDVPEGWWRVKYEKEEYETTWSEWLPVPPPQTEVNVGLKFTGIRNLSYEITFDPNNGTLTGNQTENTSAEGTLSSSQLVNPTRSGYTFNGWYTAKTGGTKISTGTVFDQNTTVYAQWTAKVIDNSYIITLDPTGGILTGNDEVETNQSGQLSSSQLTVPTYEGYTFKGWFLYKTGPLVVDETYIFNRNLTIYAQWISNDELGEDQGEEEDEEEDVHVPVIDLPIVSVWYEGKFIDVTIKSWYHDSVQYVHQRGLMNGTSSDLFSAYTPTTRCMIVTILHNMAGNPWSTASSFTDVPYAAYYAPAVGWASKIGVTDGVGDNSFNPDGEMTREQLVVMLYSFEQTCVGGGELGEETFYFTDFNQVSTWVREATNWAASHGIISGRDDGRFDPQAPASRGELSVILQSFAERPAM